MKIEKISVNQAKDMGLLIALILLLIAYFRHQQALIGPAIAVIILTMTWTAIFNAPARIWFGLSYLLGSTVSKVLLTIIFAVVVVPVGLIRRICGSDSMRFKSWKRGRDSVFLKREHVLTAKDLENPY